MNTNTGNEETTEFIARMRGMLLSAHQARERAALQVRVRRNNGEKMPRRKKQETQPLKSRDCAPPPARRHRLLRQAYLPMSASNDESRTGMILERAGLYQGVDDDQGGRRDQARLVACLACDGTGKVEPTPEALAVWGKRHELLGALMGPEFELKFPKPQPEKCKRCRGRGTNRANAARELTARPTGSTVSVGAVEPNPEDVLMMARAGRVTRRVESINPLHGLALRLYYGDWMTGNALMIAHGMLGALYPITPTGREALVSHRGQDPWDVLCEYPTTEEQLERETLLSSEAFELLSDATDTWDEAVEIEIGETGDAS